MNKQIVVAVKGIVVCKGRILLVKRSDKDDIGAGDWEFPGGKINFGEKSEEALLREIYEESGLKVNIKELAYCDNFIPHSNTHIILVTYLCVSSTDVILLSPEHSDFKWVKPHKLYDNICDVMKDCVSANFEKINKMINEIT